MYHSHVVPLCQDLKGDLHKYEVVKLSTGGSWGSSYSLNTFTEDKFK